MTNWSKLLPDVDGRSLWCRRLKDLISAQVADLGGRDNCSTAELSIIRRAAVLTCELERFEQKFARSDDGATHQDLDLYGRTAANLRRLLEAVGLERRARNVTPTLAEFLADRQRQQAASEDADDA